MKNIDEKHRKIGIRLIAVGALLIFIGFDFVLIILLLGEEYGDWIFQRLPLFMQVYIDLFPYETPLLFISIPGFLILFIGAYFCYGGRRFLTPMYAVEDLKDDHDLLLYLRPFSTDMLPVTVNPIVLLFFNHLTPYYWARMQFTFSGRFRFENALKAAFKRMGRLITIGDPREKIPLTGADRVLLNNSAETVPEPKWYQVLFPRFRAKINTPEAQVVSEDKWKDTVLDYIQRAKLVIIHIGYSEAVKWEIEKAATIKNPKDVILLVNDPSLSWSEIVKNSKEKKQSLSHFLGMPDITSAWNKFRDECGGLFPKNLPTDIGKSRLMIFDNDWNAHPVKPIRRNLIWFLPENPALPNRNSKEGAVDWLTWFLIPEPFFRRFARHLLNYLFLFLAFGIYLMDYWPISFATWSAERSIRWLIFYFFN